MCAAGVLREPAVQRQRLCAGGRAHRVPAVAAPRFDRSTVCAAVAAAAARGVHGLRRGASCSALLLGRPAAVRCRLREPASYCRRQPVSAACMHSLGGGRQSYGSRDGHLVAILLLVYLFRSFSGYPSAVCRAFFGGIGGSTTTRDSTSAHPANRLAGAHCIHYTRLHWARVPLETV